MCGIVGFLAKTSVLSSELGQHVVPMLDCMGARGPDSAGLAIFGPPGPVSFRRISLFIRQNGFDWSRVRDALQQAGFSVTAWEPRARHVILQTQSDPAELRSWFATSFPQIHLLSVGRSIDLFKDEGHPREIASEYGLSQLTGTHAVGHTRMATESAVSPAHAHPFTAGEDFCLVHNGSLSNPYSIRRKLERLGVHFETDNDTEAACRFLEWRMREGDSLEDALEKGFLELDGFYTLLMATADKLVLVRDAFACKPAVVAETDHYVAISSEFRALAHLPEIDSAHLFEPAPEQIYSWTVTRGA